MRNVMCTPYRGARDIEAIFDNFFRFPVLATDDDVDFVPRVNVKDTDHELTLVFEVPGMDRTKFKVTVKDNLLTVSGERNFKSEEKGDNYLRTEIRSGQFSRSFTLPNTVVADKISADYKNGLLEITLPKREEVKPREVEVKAD
ncbi:MAG: Hsp20/alpha crystallin family protein [Candidatus Zixiibacteriota bacterium]